MTDETPKTNLFGKPSTAAPTESKPPVEAAPAKEPEPQVETAEPVVKESNFEAKYASPQIARLRIGKFQFENGVLTIKNEKDAELFESLLAGATIRTRQCVSKIDREAGEKIAAQFLASSRGQMIRGGDTTANMPPAATPGEQRHV